jgi:hypothetical protein
MATQPVFENPQTQALLDAGKIDPNGVGIPQDYPRMVYKEGKAPGHMLADKPLQIDGKDVTFKLVHNADDEAFSIKEGWFLNPSLVLTKEQQADKALTEKDAEIARLKAQLEGSIAQADGEQVRRGPGRPPKALAEEPSNG